MNFWMQSRFSNLADVTLFCNHFEMLLMIVVVNHDRYVLGKNINLKFPEFFFTFCFKNLNFPAYKTVILHKLISIYHLLYVYVGIVFSKTHLFLGC